MGFCVWEVGASGPLVGVDHWRVKKVADCLKSATKPRASGPLFKVDH